MLKYHNYDNASLPLEIRVNGVKLEIEDKLGRELIDKMRQSYFAIFDLISLTDMDATKKRLMKNKAKAIVVEIWANLMQQYVESKEVSVFTNAIGQRGIVVESMNDFISFAFSDSKSKEYFITEVLKIFSTNIYGLSLLK